MRDKFDKIKNTLNKTVNIKRTYLLIIVVVSLGLLAVYFSYALFIVTAEKQGVLNITAGNLYPKISSTDLDENNRITLKSGDVKQIEVVIENINSIDATYKLYYKEIQPAVSGVGVVGLADSTRDTAVNTTSFSIGSYSSTSNKKVATVVLKNTGSSDYIVELGVKVGLSGRPITLGTGEKTLSNVSGLPNPPELVGNMIPVYSSITTSGSNIGTHWYKAENSPNTYYTNSFYDYENQKWANAVTVQIDSNTTYQNASVGKEILMSDIKTMWVWIPRFEYKLDGTYGKHLDGTAGTQANPGAFDIHFIGKDVTTAKSGYKIHPAFEFNGKQLAGIWVSKFNIGGKTMTSPVEYSIKPNIKADNTANFNSAFSTITSQFVGSDWGLPGDGNYDLHMMKNIDWGAIFYLTQSKFGKYGNPSFASGDEKAVYVNNSSSYYTGRSSGMKIVRDQLVVEPTPMME